MSNKQKENYKTAPLMYIVQPEYQDVRVHMQTLVVKKPKRTDKASVAEVVSVKVDERIEEDSKVSQPIDAVEPPTPDEGSEDSPEKQRQQRRTRKPISQMSINEKVEFFTTLPKNMPRTLCQIETNSDTYRGVIMTEVDGLVTIRTLTSTQPIDLQLEEIKAINLLGF